MDTEKKLLQSTSSERVKEIKKYGRDKTYEKINSLLPKDLREGFIFTNHALAIVDDMLDNYNENILKGIEKVFCRSFRGEEVVVKDPKIKEVKKLAQILRKLKEEKFNNANKIYVEILRYWKIDRKDKARKLKILSTKKLDSLNKGIGGSIGKQFLYFLTPNVNSKSISKLASLYGRAIKHADNLSDIEKDLSRGYINISKENIKKHRLLIKINSDKSVSLKGDLKEYKRLELKKIEQMFEQAHVEMMKVVKRNPNEKEMFSLFEEVSLSWLKQARS